MNSYCQSFTFKYAFIFALLILSGLNPPTANAQSAIEVEFEEPVPTHQDSTRKVIKSTEELRSVLEAIEALTERGINALDFIAHTGQTQFKNYGSVHISLWLNNESPAALKLNNKTVYRIAFADKAGLQIYYVNSPVFDKVTWGASAPDDWNTDGLCTVFSVAHSLLELGCVDRNKFTQTLGDLGEVFKQDAIRDLKIASGNPMQRGAGFEDSKNMHTKYPGLTCDIECDKKMTKLTRENACEWAERLDRKIKDGEDCSIEQWGDKYGGHTTKARLGAKATKNGDTCDIAITFEDTMQEYGNGKFQPTKGPLAQALISFPQGGEKAKMEHTVYRRKIIPGESIFDEEKIKEFNELDFNEILFYCCKKKDISNQ